MRHHLIIALALLPALACGDDSGTSIDTDSTSSSSTSSLPVGELTGLAESNGSESSESSTTGPMPCVSDEECTDAEAPFCGTNGECGTCSGTVDPDAACAEVDPGLPLCVGDTCVACTPENPAACTGTTPICDGATNTCVPCVAHDQCGPAACNLYTGACLPADRVFAVGGAMPDFPSLSAAVASLEAGTETTLVVHPGMPDYNEAVTVDGGRVVAFLAAEIGAGVTPPGWIQSSAGVGPQLTVGAGATVLLDGLRLSANADGVGLHADGGQAWVDRSRIVQNSGGGVLAENGAELVLRNCFVGQVSDVVSLDVVESNAMVLHSTLATSTFGATPALRCSSPLGVGIRNSIIVSQGGTPPDEVSCAAASITYSATEGVVAGEGNIAVGMFPGATPGDWFVDYATGDLHLQNDGLTLFADVALWSTGDPPTDIDGDPRPAIDGTPDYAGADVP